MGWNPLSWPAAITSTAYTGAGYVARPFSKDYAEFLWTAGAVGRGSDYAPAEFSKGSSNTQEMKDSLKETTRYTKRVVEEIAPNVETAAVTTAQTLAAISSAGILGAPAVERITDEFLVAQGEAPTRSLIKMYSPVSETADFGKVGNFVVDNVLGIRGDEHYKKSGLPDSHPASIYNPANHPTPTPQPPTFLESLQSHAKGFLGMATEKTGLPFGLGSLIGAIIGIVTMFFNPLVGGALLVGGLLFGQKITDAIIPAQTTNTTSSTTPQNVAQRSENPSTNLSPSYTPTVGLSQTTNLGRV